MNSEVGIIIPAETESPWKALCGCALDTDHPWCQSDKAAWKTLGGWLLGLTVWDKHESPAFSHIPTLLCVRLLATFWGKGHPRDPETGFILHHDVAFQTWPPFESLPAAKVWRPLETHLNSQVWDMTFNYIPINSITILLQTRDVIAEPQAGSKTE